MTNEEAIALEAQELAIYAARIEKLAGEGKLYEACEGFCHEGLQVHEVVYGRPNPDDNYVRFGFCSADVRVPYLSLPAEFRQSVVERGEAPVSLYSMEADDWPQVMKDAMRPLVDHALKILRDGGSGC